MASSVGIESHRAGAEVVTGDAECKKKIMELLEEFGLPMGLFPLEDIQEFGFNRDSGFMWIQGKKVDHTFKKINQTVIYADEVTAFIQKGKMTKLTGVKGKKLILQIPLVEVSVPQASPQVQIVIFKACDGKYISFDAAAFAPGE